MAEWALVQAIDTDRLNGNAKLVFTLLGWLAGEDGVTAPYTNQEIAARLNCGVSTVTAAMRRLQDLGFVKVGRRCQRGGTVYELCRTPANVAIR